MIHYRNVWLYILTTFDLKQLSRKDINITLWLAWLLEGKWNNNACNIVYMACSSMICFVSRWTGSLYFSDLAKTEKSRQKFAKNIAKLVNKYDLDGVNLDWGM